MSMMRKTLTITARDMARAFASAPSQEQADFLMELAEYVEKWRPPFSWLAQCAKLGERVTDSDRARVGRMLYLLTGGVAGGAE